MELRVSPARTTYEVNDGAGLGVGRTNVGAGAVGLAEGIGADGVEPGDGVAPGPSSPGTRSTAATRETTTITSAAASHGESRTERRRLRLAGSYVMARV